MIIDKRIKYGKTRIKQMDINKLEMNKHYFLIKTE